MSKEIIQHRLIVMTDKEEKGPEISYSPYESSYGPVLIASSPKGIVFIGFGAEEMLTEELQARYPSADISRRMEPIHKQALMMIDTPQAAEPLPLHLKGTSFQLAVWKALLQIPYGKTTDYGRIARAIHRPGAARAVGNAVGRNPIACLIPCHRVLRSDKRPGGYHWGTIIKEQLLKSESTQYTVQQEKQIITKR